MDYPDWMLPAPSAQPTLDVPAWLLDTPLEQLERTKPSPERKALMFTQFEMVFPRVLEHIYTGSTLRNAVNSLPIEIDIGAFTAWLYKDSKRKNQYLEAKEIRSEALTGEMMRHALGEDTLCDIDRSKFLVDTYKWLVSRENRKQYGDTKTIEMNTTISITAALNQAQERVIEATVVDDDNDPDLMDEQQYRQLSAPRQTEESDDE